jgi:hypothetical protein
VIETILQNIIIDGDEDGDGDGDREVVVRIRYMTFKLKKL